MKTFYQGSNNEYRSMYINAEEDFCAVKRDKTKSRFVNVMLKNIGLHTNIDRPCPWKPDVYFIKDWNFGMKHAISLVPEGRYFMNLTMMGQSKKYISHWVIYFHVENLGILDLSRG